MNLHHTVSAMHRVTESDEFWARIGIGIFLAAFLVQTVADGIAFFG